MSMSCSFEDARKSPEVVFAPSFQSGPLKRHHFFDSAECACVYTFWEEEPCRRFIEAIAKMLDKPIDAKVERFGSDALAKAFDPFSRDGDSLIMIYATSEEAIHDVRRSVKRDDFVGYAIPCCGYDAKDKFPFIGWHSASEVKID